MHGLVVAALGVDVGEGGKSTGGGVLVKLSQGLDVGVGSTAVLGPLVESGVGVEAFAARAESARGTYGWIFVTTRAWVYCYLPRTGGGVLIVGPGNTLLRELLKD